MVKVLADDFLCTQSGAITDIHIWGSWLLDHVSAVPNHGTFVIGIYSDIPDPDGDGPAYSMPGELLWDMKFRPGEYAVRVEADGPEQFFDPNLNEIIGTDNIAWQYNFLIDEALAYRQELGKVYWLSVMNVDPDNDGAISLIDLSTSWQDKTASAGSHRGTTGTMMQYSSIWKTFTTCLSMPSTHQTPRARCCHGRN